MRVKSRTKIGKVKGEAVNLVDDADGFVLKLNYYEKGSPYRTKYSVGEGLDHLAFQMPNPDEAPSGAKKAGHPPCLVIKTESSRWAYIEDLNRI